MSKIRAFIAVETPGEIQAQALQLIRELSVSPATVKWVEPDAMHWSLKFLGEIELTDVAEVCKAVIAAAASFAPFDVESHGAGAFPNLANPKTLWMGIRSGAEAMTALQQAIENRLTPLGFREEARRFQPHLTLGRVRSNPPGNMRLGQLVRRFQDFDGGLSTVYEVLVMSSELTQSGPVYEALGRARLGGKSSTRETKLPPA